MHHVRSVEVPVGNPKAGIKIAGALKCSFVVDVADACPLQHGIADTRPNRRNDRHGCVRGGGWGNRLRSGRNGFVFDVRCGFGVVCFHVLVLCCCFNECCDADGCCPYDCLTGDLGRVHP